MKEKKSIPTLFSKRVLVSTGAIIAGMGLSGCKTVPGYQQSYLSKPNMQFEDALVYNTEPQFQGSFDPGSPTASGAGATGCAACR